MSRILLNTFIAYNVPFSDTPLVGGRTVNHLELQVHSKADGKGEVSKLGAHDPLCIPTAAKASSSSTTTGATLSWPGRYIILESSSNPQDDKKISVGIRGIDSNKSDNTVYSVARDISITGLAAQ